MCLALVGPVVVVSSTSGTSGRSASSAFADDGVCDRVGSSNFGGRTVRIPLIVPPPRATVVSSSIPIRVVTWPLEMLCWGTPGTVMMWGDWSPASSSGLVPTRSGRSGSTGMLVRGGSVTVPSHVVVAPCRAR